VKAAATNTTNGAKARAGDGVNATTKMAGTDGRETRARDTLNAPSTPTAQRKRTTTMWLDRSRAGKAPWGPAKTGLLGVAGLAGIVGLTSLWAVPHVEDKLSAAAFENLEANGIDTDGLDIDFDWTDDYRSAKISGDLPAGTSAEEIEAIAADTDGVRNASVDPGPAPVAEPEPPEDLEPEPEVEPEPVEPIEAAATTAVGATATLVNEGITLDGEVATDDQKAELVAAAEEAVGADNVTDNLTVANLEPEVEGADDRVTAMASVIAGMGSLVDGQVEMTDSDLAYAGTAASDEDKDAAEELALGADDAFDGVEAAIAVEAPPEEPPGPEVTLEDEVDLLQAEIDLLRDEIRENVIFDTDADVVTTAAAGTLDKVAAAMQKYQRPVVEVRGHTDSDGNDAYNLELSQRRTESVDAYLAEQGIETTRLQGRGFGEQNPIETNDTEEGKQENRRVEFVAKATF